MSACLAALPPRNRFKIVSFSIGKPDIHTGPIGEIAIFSVPTLL